jgi:hypothetical protein
MTTADHANLDIYQSRLYLYPHLFGCCEPHHTHGVTSLTFHHRRSNPRQPGRACWWGLMHASSEPLRRSLLSNLDAWFYLCNPRFMTGHEYGAGSPARSLPKHGVTLQMPSTR